MFRKIALVLALGAVGAAGFAQPQAAQADIVDDVVCYVKTGNAFVCFRMGPSGQRQEVGENAVLCYVKTRDMIRCFHAGPVTAA